MLIMYLIPEEKIPCAEAGTAHLTFSEFQPPFELRICVDIIFCQLILPRICNNIFGIKNFWARPIVTVIRRRYDFSDEAN